MNLKVDSDIELRLIELSDAEDIFRTIDTQRTYLGKWLPFVKTTKSVDDIIEFINFVRSKPKEKSEFAFTIRKDNQLVGLIDLKETDLVNKKTELGYWLSQEFQGQGIMTKAVVRICNFAFDDLKLNRIQIKCANGNNASKNIPKRLGFVYEGLERNGELLSDGKYVDLETYSKLKSEQ